MRSGSHQQPPSRFFRGGFSLLPAKSRACSCGGEHAHSLAHTLACGSDLAGGVAMHVSHSRELRCATGLVMRMGQMAVSLTDRDSCGGEPRHRPLGVRHRVCP